MCRRFRVEIPGQSLLTHSATTRKHTMVGMMGQNYFKEGANERLGGKYTKCNKINNNSENIRAARLLPGGRAFAPLPPFPPIVAGLLTHYAVLRKVSHCFYIYANSCVALAVCRGDGSEQHKLVTRFDVYQVFASASV